MVEEYRQALLIRKLDQHYVDRSIDTTFTENEIAAYYNAHKADFRLTVRWSRDGSCSSAKGTARRANCGS